MLRPWLHKMARALALSRPVSALAAWHGAWWRREMRLQFGDVQDEPGFNAAKARACSLAMPCDLVQALKQPCRACIGDLDLSGIEPSKLTRWQQLSGES